jgi:hypothetical protein
LDNLKKSGRFALMSFVTTLEQGMSDSMGQVIDEISRRKVTILVIDSFTAIKAAITKNIPQRYTWNQPDWKHWLRGFRVGWTMQYNKPDLFRLSYSRKQDDGDRGCTSGGEYGSI